MANFGQKTPFLAISGPRDPRWLVKVEQMMDHSRAHVGDYSRCKALQKNAQNGMEMVQKWPIMGPKHFFLDISGPRGPKEMVKVEQMVDHSKTCLWYLPLMQNSPEKCTQWCRKGAKVFHLRPKKIIFGPK